MVPIQGQGWSQAPCILTLRKPLTAYAPPLPAPASLLPGELSRFLSCVRLRLTIKEKKLGFKDELSPKSDSIQRRLESLRRALQEMSAVIQTYLPLPVGAGPLEASTSGWFCYVSKPCSPVRPDLMHPKLAVRQPPLPNLGLTCFSFFVCTAGEARMSVCSREWH